jgi:peptidoglycan/LPS O-acetylase OafA/YrhL
MGKASASRVRSHLAQHRPDIDGLRAVAILAVVGYHARPSWLPGGFVGVDIFFVISGYLISGIIFGALDRGTFSFGEFYARRIKRIFPALLLVLVVVLAFGWYSLYSDEFQALGKHVAAGAAFVSNVVLWREAGYFDPDAELKPLLHLWSLGIEEQFYLLWPLLFYVVWTRRISPLLVLVGITAASLALSLLWMRGHEVRTFYLPLTRCWELALGGMLARLEAIRRSAAPATSWVPMRYMSALDSRLGRNVIAAAGAVLLGVALIALTKDQPFPGWRALLPTVGSFLLIAAGPQAWCNRALLGNRLMVFFGLISYPLYLWHWPLLSFQHILGADTIAGARLIATLGLAVALAWLTYRFVEKPVRSSRARLGPSVTLSAGVATAGIIGCLMFVQLIPPRSSRYGVDALVSVSEQRFFPGPHLAALNKLAPPVLEQGQGRQKVLFLGDSHVEQYYPRIDWLITKNPAGTRGVVYSSLGGCPPIPHVREIHQPMCDGLIERGIALAHDPDIDTIVVAADWTGYFLGIARSERYAYVYEDSRIKGALRDTMGSPASDAAFHSLEEMVGRFTGMHKIVYLVLPSPTGVMFEPRRMIDRSLGDLSFRLQVPTIDTASVVERIRPVVARLRLIAKHTGAIAIDPIPALCTDSCELLTPEGLPVFMDESHLNPAFVKTHVHYLDDVLQLHATHTAQR